MTKQEWTKRQAKKMDPKAGTGQTIKTVRNEGPGFSPRFAGQTRDRSLNRDGSPRVFS